jgi:hypothetical protein
MTLPRNWTDKLGGWRKQVIDQTLHFAWGLLIALPLAYYSAPLWVCVTAPIIAMLPREVVDQWPVNSWNDTLVDLAFFGASGFLAKLIF